MFRVLFLVAAAASCAVAHDGRPGRPRFLTGRSGGRVVPRSSGNDIFGPALPKLESRQVSTDNRCGVKFGTRCPNGDCCSLEGWCGKGPEYCNSPDCQLEFSDSCDGNKKPQGKDTEKVDRKKVGDVPYGQGIYDCGVDGAVALTYDDGPFTFTEDLLNLLKQYKAKATFFITGTNIGKGAINDRSKPWPALIKRMFDEGHQVASHTWSHQNLTDIKQETFRQQVLWNEVALADVLDGRFPTYLRPPYSSSNAKTDGWLADLGYHIVYFDLDTEGYLHPSPSQIQTSKDIWDKTVPGKDPATNKWLAIEHDIIEQSVHNLTEYMLKSLASNGFRSVTVGECLRDPAENWYRRMDGAGAKAAEESSAVVESTAQPTPGTDAATSVVASDAEPAATTAQPSYNPSLAKRVITKTIEVIPVPAKPNGAPSANGRCGTSFGGAR
ncbi:Chitin deacetylase [Purpureocillium takamizusanense]|uniref:Chitin deacetylase n=1 Tax=Purpureocillium takamizusanense TaxID=2060973 RepID=A0A9Q8QCU7_9HYPO|nr:Chitin deacetylase [Purpureocillium takamizusanense]UNI16856.1 Chitin deacetylase [Purpureocillium takamizusanense]